MNSNSIIIIIIFNLLYNINLLVCHVIQRLKTQPESFQLCDHRLEQRIADSINRLSVLRPVRGYIVYDDCRIIVPWNQLNPIPEQRQDILLGVLPFGSRAKVNHPHVQFNDTSLTGCLC